MDRKIIQPPETVKVKPKYVPIRCVVCNGFGTVKHGTKVCQGCGGKGYILVPAEETDGQKLHQNTK